MRRLERAEELWHWIRRPEDARVLEHERDGSALEGASPAAAQDGDPEYEQEAAHRGGRWSARLDEEVGATVLGPARLGVLPAHGPLLAVAQRGDPLRLDATRDEVVHRGLGASVAEGHVVGVRAPLVAVTLDEDERGRVRPKPGGAGVEEPRVAQTDIVAVEVEVDVLELGPRGELRDGRTRRPRPLGARRPGRLREAGGPVQGDADPARAMVDLVSALVERFVQLERGQGPLEREPRPREESQGCARQDLDVRVEERARRELAPRGPSRGEFVRRSERRRGRIVE